jgi:excisionase family DNA binding protein
MDPHVTSFGPMPLPQGFDRVSVSVRHAAMALDVSQPTIWTMIREGRLQSFAVGKRRLITWQSVLALRDGPPQDARRNRTVPALGSRPGKRPQKNPAPATSDLSTPVANLGLSTRTKNALGKARVGTLKELVSHSEQELLDLPNFGRTCLTEIKALLLKHDLHFNTESAL